DVSLFVEADARRPMVRLPRMDGTHDLSIRLTSDGRLASVSGTTHGLLADAIAASLSAASFAAGLVGAAIAPRLPALPTVASTPKPPPTMPHILAEREEVVGECRPAEPKPETPRELWEEQDPDGDATRLEKARVALHKLHTALIE